MVRGTLVKMIDLIRRDNLADRPSERQLAGYRETSRRHFQSQAYEEEQAKMKKALEKERLEEQAKKEKAFEKDRLKKEALEKAAKEEMEKVHKAEQEQMVKAILEAMVECNFDIDDIDEVDNILVLTGVKE